MKKHLPFLALFLACSLICLSADAQTPVKKMNKKALRIENLRLNKMIDSLRTEIDLLDPVSELTAILDTTAITETIIEPSDESFVPDDSLDLDQRINLFYRSKQFYNFADTVSFQSLDSLALTSDIPDSVFIDRLTRMNSFIKLPYNQVVKNYILLYTQKMKEKSPLLLGLAQYYMPLFEEIFDAHDLPLELKAMAIIESALNPRAVSRAKAKGMWQFMYRTARVYKLNINSYVDERLDPIASGHAAAAYLKDAYNIFGDWTLAISSYNCGAGNVNKAIRRSGGSREFWDIWPYLPRETRGYVPAFVAALYLMHYYPEHQIKPLAVRMPAQVDTFEVKKMLHFEQIAAVIDMSVEELRDLNPQYTEDIIPGIERTYLLRIPSEYSGLFAEKEKEIYAYKDSVFFDPLIINKTTIKSESQISHKVRSGESLGLISQRYGVKISDIKYWNGLRSNTIRVGQRLVIYTNRPAARSKSASTISASKTESDNPEIHVVKRGENLGSIAIKYNMSVSRLKSLNNLKSNTIMPGQKLKLKGSDSTTTSSTSGSYTTYTIKKGDSLWEISKRFGVSVQSIQNLNSLSSRSKLQVGQKIKIPK